MSQSKVSKTYASLGERIDLTAKADAGYKFSHWQVIKGNLSTSSVSSLIKDFIMPGEDVEIEAVFIPIGGGGGTVMPPGGGIGSESSGSDDWGEQEAGINDDPANYNPQTGGNPSKIVGEWLKDCNAMMIFAILNLFHLLQYRWEKT